MRRIYFKSLRIKALTTKSVTKMATAEHVVVDSGAFIRNAPIKDIGKKVYTVSDVVSEIRDKPTRERLQVLPYVIKFQEPDTGSLRIVTEFTKKTGDYRSLSATDIKLLALTYQLEKRHVGVDHIKTVPDRKIVFETGSNAKLQTEVAGFYLKKENTKSSAETSTSDAADGGIKQAVVEVDAEKDVSEKLATVELDDGDHQSAGDEDDPPTENVVQNKVLKDGDSLQEEITEYSSSEDDVSDDEDDSDEDEGWITPHNVDEMNKAMTGGSGGEATTCTVGCLTTDFAMQNVLIHMGLNVISVDGLLIKKAKSYILRCYSCFKVSTDVSRQFCHHCGNQTLRRLSVAVNDDGTMQYFLSKKQFKIRKQPHIPLPKGGKYSNYPKLTEDQKLPQRRQAKQKQQHYGVFDPDYIANSSPFSLRDTTSRSALTGAGRNFNKRNPNAGVRRRKK